MNVQPPKQLPAKSSPNFDAAMYEFWRASYLVWDYLAKDGPLKTSVTAFGAVGDGVNDDSGPIQRAINEVGGKGGGVVFFPAGLYRCNTNLTITSNNVWLVGEGKNASVLAFYTTSGFGVEFLGSSLSLCGMEGLGLAQYVPSTGILLVTTGVFRFNALHCFFNGAPGGVNLTSGVVSLSGTSVYMIACDGVGGDDFGLQLLAGNDFFVSKTTHLANTVNGSPLLINAVTNGAVWVDNCAFLGGGFCLISGSRFVSCTAVYFDSAQGGVQVSGGSSHVYFESGCEFANRVTTGSGDGAGLTLGDCDNVTVNGAMIINCSGSGMIINSAAHHVTVTGGTSIDGNNTANSATGYGMVIGGDASHIKVTDTTIGNITAGFGGHQKYGIVVNVGSGDYIQLAGNDTTNNETGGILDSGGGSHSYTINNAGYNPVGVSAILAGASPYTYTAGHTDESVYIRGGTVSSIMQGAATLFTSTDQSVYLGPNESIVITHTGAPILSIQKH